MKKSNLRGMHSRKKPHTKPHVAISIGDINGVGAEIALREHSFIKTLCEPLYCVHKELMQNAAQLLGVALPNDMVFAPPKAKIPTIHIAKISKKSGAYSFESFITGLDLLDNAQAQAIITLPIHKAAWKKAGIDFVGHTEVLSARYDKKAIMALGNQKMLVGLFSDHIPLKKVSQKITASAYEKFLLLLFQSLQCEKALVLGFNPHCGDNGAIGGKEDSVIKKAIQKVNARLTQEAQKQKIQKTNAQKTRAKTAQEIFVGPYPPDTAFIPHLRNEFKVFVAPYHDIGLATLKALYFDSSINISLNLPIIRTSVDHGVAYDLAYKGICNTQSYKNAVCMALELIQKQAKNKATKSNSKKEKK
ncbi:4-hydroxythreonine-4-phosphate dehydrogenase [uncultured Helicobacter sp.]|uniref:4-hydroxythreonine-4-phosphate dehydrogenase n=1 Tax=uncultured Helicobacter sp. TaxID=175537 RepID=UPI00258A918C|nr:4-hydroxythreonine-4-phosphate dehydrogenase [uncultured Helicobacter sp.]